MSDKGATTNIYGLANHEQQQLHASVCDIPLACQHGLIFNIVQPYFFVACIPIDRRGLCSVHCGGAVCISPLTGRSLCRRQPIDATLSLSRRMLCNKHQVEPTHQSPVRGTLFRVAFSGFLNSIHCPRPIFSLHSRISSPVSRRSSAVFCCSLPASVARDSYN